jgi:hypothetical protein
MSLTKHAQQAGVLALEASALLDKGQAEDVRETLACLSYADWAGWKIDHEKQISLFVLSTPAERKKSCKNISDYPLIVYAAFEEYWNAQALLRLLSRHRIDPGLSYRGVAYEAAQVVQGVVALPIPPWPFRSESPWPEFQETLEDFEDRELSEHIAFAKYVDTLPKTFL